jgi:hypothetical protein
VLRLLAVARVNIVAGEEVAHQRHRLAVHVAILLLQGLNKTRHIRVRRGYVVSESSSHTPLAPAGCA